MFLLLSRRYACSSLFVIALLTATSARAIEPGLWEFHSVRAGAALGGLYSLNAEKTAQVCLSDPSVANAVRALAEKNHCSARVEGSEAAERVSMTGTCRHLGIAVAYTLTASVPAPGEITVVLTALPNRWLTYSDHTHGRRLGDCAPPARP
jgi:hypothetical protein